MGSQGTQQPVRAVDTNVIIRLIVSDHPVQTRLAEAELGTGIFLSHGILMEAEWVLRSFYKLPREEILAALDTLVEHAGVSTPDRDGVRWALSRYGGGADFADMLHLLAATGQPEFASFEIKLANLAGPKSPVRVVHLQ